MKYLSKLILIFLFGTVNSFATAPDTAWTRTYRRDSTAAYGYSVQQTTDRGYIISGLIEYSYDNTDVYLIKTDSLGDTLWTRTYGGADNFDEGESVQQTTDGGYIVAGTTVSYGTGREDFYLIKTDSIGDTLWTRTYGYSTDTGSVGYSVQQTDDGGYIVAGGTYSYSTGKGDVYLIKTDSIGDTLWTKTYGGTDYDHGYSVQQTTDGGYIVAGFTVSYGAGAGDVYLIKTDTLGDTLWTRIYGGANDDVGHSVQQTTDAGYIVAGGTESSKPILIKTDSLGDTLWTKTYGESEDRGFNSVQQTTDSGYIAVGLTDAHGGDIFLIKTNASGNTLWTGTYGGSDHEDGYSVQQTTDGGYIVTGVAHRDYYCLYLIKLKPGSSGVEEEITSGLLSLSLAEPNPFTTTTTVKYELTKATDVNVSIYNLLGQEVKKLYSGKQSSGIHFVTWDGSGNSGKLPTGIYFLRIEAGNQESSVKLTLIR